MKSFPVKSSVEFTVTNDLLSFKFFTLKGLIGAQQKLAVNFTIFSRLRGATNLEHFPSKVVGYSYDEGDRILRFEREGDGPFDLEFETVEDLRTSVRNLQSSLSEADLLRDHTEDGLLLTRRKFLRPIGGPLA